MKKIRISNYLTLLLIIATLQASYGQTCDEFGLSVNGISKNQEVATTLLQTADSLVFESDVCNRLLRIHSFGLSIGSKNFEVKGNRFSGEMKKEMAKAKPGFKVLLYDVKTVDRDDTRKIHKLNNQGLVVVFPKSDDNSSEERLE